MSIELTQQRGVAGQPRRPAPRGRAAWWLAQAQAQPMAALGAAIVLAWVVVALCAPVLAPYDYTHGTFSTIMAPPSLQHVFGTDNFGRDVLSRVLMGSRTVLLLAAVSTLASLVCGTVIGLVAGYYGAIVDEAVMRFADAAMALPAILLAVRAVKGPTRTGAAISLTPSLGFLGAGVQPPTPDWGVMVAEAQDYATQAPWMVIFPALAISSLVIGVNLVSDGVKQLVIALEQRGTGVDIEQVLA